jgi:hypothetical protein
MLTVNRLGLPVRLRRSLAWAPAQDLRLKLRNETRLRMRTTTNVHHDKISIENRSSREL